jgi:hypothetical protein
MAVAISAAQAAGALLAQSAAPAHGPARTLGFVALITWLLDAGSGLYMLSTWIRHGGLRRVRAEGEGLAPVLVFSHFGLASAGLLLWISFLVTRVTALAWVAVTLLVLVIGLGISTVTLWTPFPARPASGSGPDASDATALTGGQQAGPAGRPLTGAVTDDTLARALTDDALLQRLVEEVVASVPADPARPGKPARGPREHIAALIPAGHGIAALTTAILAVLAAVAAL